MAEIPRALGFTDNQIQDALAQSVVVTDEGGQQVLNPFSSMGISDQDYVEMLQGIAMEKEGKRGLEVVRDEGTARFQEGESPWHLDCSRESLLVEDDRALAIGERAGH
jgi:osomolarity two-component system response regulator SKN7